MLICFSNITITHSIFQMNSVNYFKDLFESVPDYKNCLINVLN